MADNVDKRELRRRVLLFAYDAVGKIVTQESMSIDDYYDELHPVIDDNSYRKRRNIRSIKGEIYDLNGNLDQQSYVEYNESGDYVRSRILYSDGTVIED